MIEKKVIKILPTFLSFSPFQRHIIQLNFVCLTGFPVEKDLQTNYFFQHVVALDWHCMHHRSAEYVSITSDNAHAKHFMRVKEW